MVESFTAQEAISLVSNFKELSYRKNLFHLFVNIDGKKDYEPDDSINAFENGSFPEKYMELGYFDLDNPFDKFSIVHKRNGIYFCSQPDDLDFTNCIQFNNQDDLVNHIVNLIEN